MIQIDYVSKSYDGGKTFSVKDLSLEIRDGEIFGLLGPNGAGKSTTLNMLAGVLAPTKGTVKVNGIDVTVNPIEAKRSLCFVGDSPDHLLRLRGRDTCASSPTSMASPRTYAPPGSQSSPRTTAWRRGSTTRSAPTPTACARR